MPLLPGKKNIGKNIAKLRDEGKKETQAIAIAENVAKNAAAVAGPLTILPTVQKKDKVEYELKCELPDIDNHKFYIERDVPIFHDGDEGKYSKQDLQYIADNSNKRKETCDLSAIVLGHAKDDAPETEKPPVVGFARNFRVVQFANRPTIIADLHIHNDHKDKLKDYPRRSAEIWDDSYIDPIALLKSTPARDLSLTYEKKSKNCNCQSTYSKEVLNMDPKEIAAEVVKALESTGLFDVLKSLAEPKKLSEEEEKGEEDVLKGEEEVMQGEDKEAMDKDEQTDKGVEMDMEKEKEDYAAAKRQLAKYSKTLQGYEARINQLEREGRMAVRKADLMQLESEGYELPDFSEELESVSDMTPARYSKHLERIRKCYRKAPLGMGEVRPVTPSKANSKSFDYEDSKKAADMVCNGRAKTVDEAFNILRGL